MFSGTEHIVSLSDFASVTLGIIVLFLGRRLNLGCSWLREFNIPDSVSGGIFVSIIITLLYALFHLEIHFDLRSRDILLVYFFTTIGINASFSDLKKGGKPLVVLLAITIIFMLLQNLTGITIATLFGLPSQVGVIGGTVSLIGGHGTAIAWAPKIQQQFGIENAMELGIASATLGLVLASLIGGPIAKYLIGKYNLSSEDHALLSDDAVSTETAANTRNKIDHFDFLDAILAIHIAGIVGIALNELLKYYSIELPLFVTCLFAGILITNVVPKNFPRLTGRQWPTRQPAIKLIADVSLGTFLAMSLMSMQLWTLIDLAVPFFVLLLAQLLLSLLMIIFVVFPCMGRNYDAAVICAGFGGISLGATPTAMANMSAVSERYGASQIAFIIVPLVCAFFIDIVNAFVIPIFLNIAW